MMPMPLLITCHSTPYRNLHTMSARRLLWCQSVSVLVRETNQHVSRVLARVK
jgi:hypothetical protein